MSHSDFQREEARQDYLDEKYHQNMMKKQTIAQQHSIREKWNTFPKWKKFIERK